MKSPKPEPGERLYSIGGASKSSGISPATLRVWERRYGRPTPVRLPSGHRRFRESDVRWLKQMAEALARGNRPSRIVHLSDEELTQLLSRGDGKAESESTQALLATALELRGDDLETKLRLESARLGPQRFLTELVAPLVTVLGRAWADGRIDVRHEHLASQRIEDVLRSVRSAAHPHPEGPSLLLTTLPSEQHGLGVQMAALMAAVAGAKVHVLGTETPREEICAAAEDLRVDAVGISVSLGSGGPETDRNVAALLATMPKGVGLLVGGAGARGVRRGVQGVQYLASLDELDEWVRDWIATAS